MPLERVHDLGQERLVRRALWPGQVGHVPEVEPGVQAVVGGGILELELVRDLVVDPGGRPCAPTCADEVDAGALDLLEALLAVRRLLPDRRRVREPEREELLPLDDEHTGRIDCDGTRHRP